MGNKHISDEKKNEMLEKCFNCYCEYGLKGAGIKKLAEACEMSTANLFFHFGTIDNIIIESTAYCMVKVEDEFTIGDKNVLLLGKTVENDVAPLIKNDRTMLPARFVAENFGAEVLWDETAPGIVTIKKDDIVIVIKLGEEYATVNGKQIKLDSSAFVENDRTYLPVRFVSENLGANIEWLPEQQRIVISVKKSQISICC